MPKEFLLYVLHMGPCHTSASKPRRQHEGSSSPKPLSKDLSKGIGMERAEIGWTISPPAAVKGHILKMGGGRGMSYSGQSSHIK